MPTFKAYAYLRDEKSANTSGGTFTQGAWRTRDLNTEVTDPDGIVSLSANQFTLGTGTYYIFARAPAYACNRHRAKLRNITAGSDALLGSSIYATTAGTNNDTFIEGIISPAGSTTYEIQHQCQVTVTGNGFGVEGNFGITEVYTEVWIWELSTDFRISDLTDGGALDNDDQLIVARAGTSLGIVGAALPGAELDYVERTTNLSVTATVEASANTFISGNSVAYDGSTDVLVEVFISVVESSQFCVITLWDGGTDLGRLCSTAAAGGTFDMPVLLRRKLTPSAAAHTYHVKAYRGTGSGTLYAGSGGAGVYLPAYLRITKA